MFRINTITNSRLINCLLICAFLIISVSINAQSDKKFIRQGNREYEKNKFSDSEISYRKAIDRSKESPDAVFNVGDALYKQSKFEDAGKQFIENINLNDNKNKKSAGLYNLGNSLLKSNKVEESIEAYKESLKLRPDNNEAKYNLAYAQDLLRQEQEQKQQKKEDKDNKDQNKDGNKEDQKKEQEDKDKDQQKDQKNSQDQQQQQQEQQQRISKDDAQRLLNALANDEKNVQEKVKLAKAAKAKVRTVKNW